MNLFTLDFKQSYYNENITGVLRVCSGVLLVCLIVCMFFIKPHKNDWTDWVDFSIERGRRPSRGNSYFVLAYEF